MLQLRLRDCGGHPTALRDSGGVVAAASARAREKVNGLHLPEFTARSWQTQNDGEY
jgi:hypothetical protein